MKRFETQILETSEWLGKEETANEDFGPEWRDRKDGFWKGDLEILNIEIPSAAIHTRPIKSKTFGRPACVDRWRRRRRYRWNRRMARRWPILVISKILKVELLVRSVSGCSGAGEGD